MNLKVIAGSAAAMGLMGMGMLAGSVVGSGGAFAQTPAAVNSTSSVASVQSATTSGAANTYQVGNTFQVSAAAQAATTPVPSRTQGTTPANPIDNGNSGSSTITAKITQQQAEQAALAANPGSTVDHTSLQDQNGSPVYDVDFTNGGGALVDGNTGAVISSEAAGTDQGGHGPGGRGGADQAALAAQAKVTQQQAEQAALAASPGNTVDHSILQDQNGTIIWDVDFTNGGGVQIDATTGVVITTEAAGTDQGGPGFGPGGHAGKHDNGQPTTSTTPTTQP